RSIEKEEFCSISTAIANLRRSWPPIASADWLARRFRCRFAGKNWKESKAQKFLICAPFHNVSSKTAIHGKRSGPMPHRFIPKGKRAHRRKTESNLAAPIKHPSNCRITRTNGASKKHPSRRQQQVRRREMLLSFIAI